MEVSWVKRGGNSTDKCLVAGNSLSTWTDGQRGEVEKTVRGVRG